MTDNDLLLLIAAAVATLMTLSQWPIRALLKQRNHTSRWAIQVALEWPAATVVVWACLYIAYSLYFNSPP